MSAQSSDVNSSEVKSPAKAPAVKPAPDAAVAPRPHPFGPTEAGGVDDDYYRPSQRQQANIVCVAEENGRNLNDVIPTPAGMHLDWDGAGVGLRLAEEWAAEYAEYRRVFGYIGDIKLLPADQDKGTVTPAIRKRRP